ncbi:MAG TPA: hypothetical protein VMW49_00595 [Candidatus Dormibacteraeota bacterium]|nr:hypothetical protein [Candidatus Dormibacteraeota bacterium]
MSPQAVDTALGAALADRVSALHRTGDRLRALETYPESAPQAADPRGDAEAALRHALTALGCGAGYALARQLQDGGTVVPPCDVPGQLTLQTLAQAGLAVWDPSSGTLAGTVLLGELLAVLEPAIAAAAAGSA